MASCTSDRCEIIRLPWEMQAMIFAALSDDRSAIVALARTCHQFYSIYHHNKEARFKYATDLINRAVGIYSPAILRLGILTVKFASILERVPRPDCEFFQDNYPIYCRENWDFSATDFEIVKSDKFEEAIRETYKAAWKRKEAIRRRIRERLERKAQNSRASRRVTQRPTPIKARDLEVQLSRDFWSKFRKYLRPRVVFLDFYCKCGPGFSFFNFNRKKDPVDTRRI